MSLILTRVFSVITAVLIMYMVLILIRVLSSWFSTGVNPPFVAQLSRITDPYLNLFRRFKFLHFQYMDLTPVAALIVLQLVIALTGNIASSHRIWLGKILEILIQMLGSAIIFLFIFFMIIAAIRFIGILMKASSVQRIWFTLDHMLQPMIYPIMSRLSPRKVMPYGNGLLIFIGINAVLAFLSSILFPQLADLAKTLPF